jgi:hypothetical protein
MECVNFPIGKRNFRNRREAVIALRSAFRAVADLGEVPDVPNNIEYTTEVSNTTLYALLSGTSIFFGTIKLEGGS